MITKLNINSVKESMNGISSHNRRWYLTGFKSCMSHEDNSRPVQHISCIVKRLILIHSFSTLVSMKTRHQNNHSKATLQPLTCYLLFGVERETVQRTDWRECGRNLIRRARRGGAVCLHAGSDDHAPREELHDDHVGDCLHLLLKRLEELV